MVEEDEGLGEIETPHLNQGPLRVHYLHNMFPQLYEVRKSSSFWAEPMLAIGQQIIVLQRCLIKAEFITLSHILPIWLAIESGR